ncbi:MAG TPA: glucose-1-phosphate thymidylyltransferase [Thermodesulforhabdus norvegica]|uniref:Glucose-1-phosphate thymidylyltransferase n=1 Tax=Thermodesulforhabdus norvegica TaxID=39841 RepID=A0A7C1AKT4_9BACT|nr:glucose-1-phosphate thymidylyltransferase [Deltaproteobacteria bacterium]MBW2068800.1 glucose-1-phosphate thymidylyltransferase [Deltaproteobacteria bacterium]HDL89287.1 glucose-1-phosphate thymidylyltransferase [Thermodesulforhabdus norvegica]
MELLKTHSFFDLSTLSFGDLLRKYQQVWKIVPDIREMCYELLEKAERLPHSFRDFQRPLQETVVIHNGEVHRSGFEILGGDASKGNFRVKIKGVETTDATVLFAGCVIWDGRVSLGKGVVIEPTALIKGPTVIGNYTEVRQGAYVRGKCIVGNHCVVGHTTEMKNSIMMDGAKAGHFAYIGDSILGQDVNLGAGVKLANLKMNRKAVKIKLLDEEIDTGLQKLGAIVGDGSELGCNSVTNPGVLMGPHSLVWPGVLVPGGYYPPNSVISSRG